MAENWQKSARQLVGQRVVIRQQNGQVTQGVLRKADQQGVYLQQAPGARFASVMKQKVQIAHAVAGETDTPETENVFFAAWFLILYALIAGLWGWGAYARAYGPGVGYGGGVPYRGGFGPGPGVGPVPYRRGFFW